MSIVRKLTAAEVEALDPEQFAFKLTIELGPGSTKGKASFTNEELAQLLEEIAECRKNSALAPMFAHLAEHIKFDAAAAADRAIFLKAAAPTTLNAVYYGCDSCGQGYCVCNDSCEECC